MERLVAILKNSCPTIDFYTAENLITDKLIDSVDLVTIISDLEDEYEINIGMEKIIPENFDSASAIYNLVESLL